MSEETTVDIALTSFNTAKYIGACLDSIRSQTYKNWKLIIVDDGSTDKTIDVIKTYIGKHDISKKCRLFSISKNSGYGTSLKIAIEKGEGEIVFVVDSDDELADNDAIKIMVEQHNKRPDVSLIYSNYYECSSFPSTRKNVVKSRNPKPNETYLSQYEKGTINEDLIISHLKSFKRSYYDMTEGLNGYLMKAVDKDLVLKLEEVGNLLHINESLYIHRIHATNISSSFKKLSSDKQKKIMEMKNEMYASAQRRRLKKSEDISV